jgi:hypothetical protein
MLCLSVHWICLCFANHVLKQRVKHVHLSLKALKKRAHKKAEGRARTPFDGAELGNKSLNSPPPSLLIPNRVVPSFLCRRQQIDSCWMTAMSGFVQNI